MEKTKFQKIQSNKSGVTRFCCNDFKSVEFFPFVINHIPIGCLSISGVYFPYIDINIHEEL